VFQCRNLANFLDSCLSKNEKDLSDLHVIGLLPSVLRTKIVMEDLDILCPDTKDIVTAGRTEQTLRRVDTAPRQNFSNGDVELSVNLPQTSLEYFDMEIDTLMKRHFTQDSNFQRKKMNGNYEVNLPVNALRIAQGFFSIRQVRDDVVKAV